jgi:flagellum-specific ATP synthase
MAESIFQQKLAELPQILPARVSARVRRVVGLVVETSALPVPVGSLCEIHARLSGAKVEAEVVGFNQEVGISQLMPLGEMRGIGPGDFVQCVATQQVVSVGPQLLGRVLDGMGRPMDDKGPLFAAATRPIYSNPPDPVKRPRIKEVLPTGVRSIDGFLTIGRGQRIGIFAGTGVGKSVLMGMISRFTSAEVSVIALVGERGREVRDFLERDLGPEGLKRSVVVIATSDQPAPVRVRAPFVATAIAEYFRDQGSDVALLMDSVTRMAMAQRDIGGSVGEVAAAKGYTPSVFAMLPRLMERSGASERGSITGLYTVLVEGDDMNEPISDATRGILDGHIALSRKLAQRGHFPAVDVMQSISRLQTEIVSKEEVAASRDLRRMLSAYADAEDLINIGAYAPGANPEIDQARAIMPGLNDFLRQDMNERADYQETVKQLLQLGEQCRRPATTAPARPAPTPPPQRGTVPRPSPRGGRR